MIKLKRLELTDFGPIKHQEFDFDGAAGTYAIQAPNQAGKSHILMALRGLLCPAAGFGKPLGAFPRQEDGKCFKSVLTAIVDIDGDELKVTKTITPATGQDFAEILASGTLPQVKTHASATYRGNSYRGVSKVDDLLRSVVGIVNQDQASAVFVMQSKAGAIWDQRQAERIRTFQSLSGSGVMEKLNKAATTRLDFYRPSDYTADLETSRAERDKLREEVEKLDAELANTMRPDKAAHDLAQTELAKNKVAEENAQRVAEASRRLGQLKAALDSAAAQFSIAAQNQNLPRSPEDLNGLRAHHSALASALVTSRQQVEQYQIYEQRVISLKSRVASLQATALATAAERAENIPELEAAVTAMKDRMSAIVLQGKGIRQFLDSFAQTRSCPTCGSTGICSSCGHVTMDIAGSVDQKVQERDALLREHEVLKRDVAIASARVSSAKELLARMEADSRVIQQAEMELRAVEDGARPPIAEEDPEAVQVRLNHATTSLHNAEAAIVDKSAAEQVHFRALSAYEAAEQSAGMEVGELLSAEDVARNCFVIETYGSAVKEVARLEAELASMRGRVAESERRVEDYEKQKAAADIDSKIASTLQMLRTATHASAIPREMASTYLDRVNARLGAYCRELRLAFTLYIEPETMTLMLRSDKLHAPAEYHWSGGQKTMIAWAWHLALYSLHGSSFGLLGMDEPSDGVDTDNMNAIAGMLSELSSFCRGAGLQLLLVTHEEVLAGVCDHKIKLAS